MAKHLNINLYSGGGGGVQIFSFFFVVPDIVQWVLLPDDERAAECFHVCNSVIVVEGRIGAKSPHLAISTLFSCSLEDFDLGEKEPECENDSES